MEENQLPENPGSAEPAGCINCGSHSVEEKHPTRLCSTCRQLFIKFPIPLTVKLFGIGVALVLIFALFSLPKNMSLAIHLEKGRKFEAHKQFKSAQREFTHVVWQVPDNMEVNEHLAIAAYYNLDLERLVRSVKQIEGKKVEDEALYNRLTDLIEKSNGFFPDNGLNELLKEYDKESEVPDAVYKDYLKEKPFEVYALFSYASRLYDKKDFTGSDTLLQRILGVNPQHQLALHMLAAIARQRRQFQESLQYCNKIIELNREAGYAYASMARTYLKWNKLAEGLKEAQRSVVVDKEDPYNVATLAIAWHMNRETTKRDNLLKELKERKDSTGFGQLQYAMDVINQKDSL